MSSSSSAVNCARSSKVWPVEETSRPPPTGDVGVQSETRRTPTRPPIVEFRRLGGHRRRTPTGVGEKTFGERCAKLRKRVSSGCRVLAGDLSEVCFVSGIITALIGSLVAISGIFTRNQARIRLYMEGFGCGMVILGVLVVFFSLKLRASKDFELNQLSNLFHTHNHNHAHHDPPHARFLHRQQQLLAQRRQHRMSGRRQSSSASHSPEPPPVLPRVTTTLAGFQRAPSARSVRMTSSLIDLAASARRDSEDDSASLASLCGANQGQAWTPCLALDLDCSSSAYYGHERATIEAALSIVLTAATIAGFRPGGQTAEAGRPLGAGHPSSGKHLCCLHHTVQHKLQARKWINCLRVAAEPRILQPAASSLTDAKTVETFRL